MSDSVAGSGTLWFLDAFNESRNWWVDSYLAIDQGPIVVMIEKPERGLLWKLFMSCPRNKIGLKTRFSEPLAEK